MTNVKEKISDDNTKVRRQLKAFMAQARKNEEKMQRFNELELQLISADSLADLLRLIVYNYRATFELDVVTLTLVDTDYEVQRMLQENGVDVERFYELSFLDSAPSLNSIYGISFTPVLGCFKEDLHGFLFKSTASRPGSVALLPLVRKGQLIGCLNLGSLRPERFVSGSGTEFLERLAAIVSICLENSTNHERLKRVGLTDPLTGVNNRRFFEQRHREEIATALRHNRALSFMFLDVDKFKSINDGFGHQLGDVVLRGVADIVGSCLRTGDILARYGGEEFVILLPKTSLDSALEVAERIRIDVSGYDFKLPGDSVSKVTISVGVSMLPPNIVNGDVNSLAEKLLTHADQALYKAKDSGRNCVVFSEP